MGYLIENYIGVLVASLAGFFVGFIWYSLLFQNLWIKEMGVKKKDYKKFMEECKSKSTRSMTLGFLRTVVLAYVFSLFLNGFNTTGLEAHLLMGFLVWLGFIATVLLDQVLWSRNDSWTLYMINASHYLAMLLSMGVVFHFM